MGVTPTQVERHATMPRWRRRLGSVATVFVVFFVAEFVANWSQKPFQENLFASSLYASGWTLVFATLDWLFGLSGAVKRSDHPSNQSRNSR